MRLAVMQPYFLPYLGYFALVERVDLFVVFDTAQFPRRGWVHRNRIQSDTTEGWAWFGVPIEKCPRDTPIRSVRLAPTANPAQLRETLRHTYSRAPFFDRIVELLGPLWSLSGQTLLELDEALLRAFAEYLGLEVEWRRSSEWESPQEAVRPPQERILALCERVGAKTYWNLPGGRGLYAASDFLDRGVDLRFVAAPSLNEMAQEFPNISELSVVDLVMQHEAETVRSMIRSWSRTRRGTADD